MGGPGRKVRSVRGRKQMMQLSMLRAMPWRKRSLGFQKYCASLKGDGGTGIFHMTSGFFYHGPRDPIPLPLLPYKVCLDHVYMFFPPSSLTISSVKNQKRSMEVRVRPTVTGSAARVLYFCNIHGVHRSSLNRVFVTINHLVCCKG